MGRWASGKWSVVGWSVVNGFNKTPPTNICLRENDGLSFCSLSIANNVKQFFSNLHKTWQKHYQLDQTSLMLSQCDNSKRLNLEENSFHFTKVSENTISDFLKEIKTNKATGIDNLSGRFLKDGSKVLATPITQICNLSIKLSAVYKKGKKTDSKNYRPISLLPIISKIFEKKSSMIKLWSL